MIDIRGAAIEPALRAHVLEQLSACVERLGVEPTTLQATFFDENGPKGGVAMRCALTARVPPRQSVRVEATAETPRHAFDASVAKLRLELERYKERARDSRRHPKKYYVAGRLMKAEPGGTRGGAAGRPAGRRRVSG
jgi:ribosome-associated translation inhibitor RaiA